MKQILTKISPHFYCLFVCLLLNSALFSQSSAINLDLSKPVNSEITDGKKKDFTVLLSAGQTAIVEVKQTGVDAAIAAVNPAGETFIETESPGGTFGSEFLYLTAIETGKYTVEVHATNPRANSGAFVIELKEIRATVPEDHQVNQAAKKITELAYQADRAKAQGTVAGRREALAKWREIHALSLIKKDRIWEALSFIAGGLIYESLGEMQNAIDFYLQSLEIYRTIGNRQYEGIAINNLGTISMETGDYDRAVSYYFQSLNFHRQTDNKKSEAVTLNNLGHAYLLLENYAKAKEFLQPALKLRIELEDQQGEANTLTNLGRTHLETGEYQKAIEFLQKALEIRRTIKNRAGEANSLLNLGKAFWEIGEKSKSFEHFTQANRLTQELGDRSEAANTFYWLAVLEQDRGNLPEAIGNVEKGLELIEKIRNELSSLDLRVTYFAKVQDFYELYTDLIVERAEKNKNQKDFELALEMSEKARSRGLKELLQEARVDIKRGVDPSLREQETDLRNALEAKYIQRERLLRGQPKREELEKNTDETNELLIKLDKLNAEIRRTNKRYAGLTQAASLSAKEIQNLLDDETVLLEYKLGKKRSFLWLATKDAVKFFILPGRQEIEQKAKAFYDLIVADNKADDAKMLELSRELSEILLASVASEIKNKRIAVVADGVLQYIPFSALFSPKSKVQTSKSNDKQFLVETNEIIVLPSASVLAELRSETAKNKSFDKTIAIFADAVYDAERFADWRRNRKIKRRFKVPNCKRFFVISDSAKNCRVFWLQDVKRKISRKFCLKIRLI